MCTLIVSFRQHARWPLIVAANRDEAVQRPARPPFIWPQGFLAPRDEQAGGTWLGLNPGGLFVGVTNRFPSSRSPERASRGELVVDALGAASARAQAAALTEAEAKRFNTFHLFASDGHDAVVSWLDEQQFHQHSLEPGLHIITERSLGGDDRSRTSLIHDAWPTLPRDADGAPTPEGLMQLLQRRRSDDPAGGVCVELPAFDYGTRSSFVLFRAPRLGDSKLWFTDGPPGTHPFIDGAPLLASMSR